jgi:hypothetical protein
VTATWDILIPTIPHRHETLKALLTELDKQAIPGFGVRVMRDNLERRGIASYAKWQDLADSSQADYISYGGDDDWVAPDFVSRVMTALEEEQPDYVGFPVRFTQDGQEMPPVLHSLRYSGWQDSPQMTRDIVHQNPMRRELSLLARWGSWGAPDEDALWAAAVRATGRVQTEAWIDDPMYWYQRVTHRNFWATTASAEPFAPADIPPLPEYPWLTALGSC